MELEVMQMISVIVTFMMKTRTSDIKMGHGV